MIHEMTATGLERGGVLGYITFSVEHFDFRDINSKALA
jgi:hypothetical protein